MENHQNEEPKSSNKWIATPILMAVILICCIVGLLGLVSGQCCGGKCDSKNETEQHEAVSGNVHNEVKSNENTTDTNNVAIDTTAAIGNQEEHGH